MAIEYVAFGDVDMMVAEVGALDMPSDWLEEYGYLYCVMPVGDEQYDTEFFKTLDEARTEANSYGVKTLHV